MSTGLKVVRSLGCSSEGKRDAVMDRMSTGLKAAYHSGATFTAGAGCSDGPDEYGIEREDIIEEIAKEMAEMQ